MLNDSVEINLTSTTEDESAVDTTRALDEMSPEIEDDGLINKFVNNMYLYYISFSRFTTLNCSRSYDMCTLFTTNNNYD